MTPTPSNGSPITYPTIVVGGKTYQLRFSHSAWYQLQIWGFTLGDPNRPIPMLALAAAAAGVVDPVTGAWRSIGFARPLDLADAMLDSEVLSAIDQPVLDALKKAAPEADLTLNQPPAETITAEVN